jgi:hypothetical protein
MTNKEFNKQVESDIDKLIQLAMEKYRKMTHLDDDEEEEEKEDLDEMTQTERDYEDDLKDRYWDMKGIK